MFISRTFFLALFLSAFVIFVVVEVFGVPDGVVVVVVIVVGIGETSGSRIDDVLRVDRGLGVVDGDDDEGSTLTSVVVERDESSCHSDFFLLLGVLLATPFSDIRRPRSSNAFKKASFPEPGRLPHRAAGCNTSPSFTTLPHHRHRLNLQFL